MSVHMDFVAVPLPEGLGGQRPAVDGSVPTIHQDSGAAATDLQTEAGGDNGGEKKDVEGDGKPRGEANSAGEDRGEERDVEGSGKRRGDATSPALDSPNKRMRPHENEDMSSDQLASRRVSDIPTNSSSAPPEAPLGFGPVDERIRRTMLKLDDVCRSRAKEIKRLDSQLNERDARYLRLFAKYQALKKRTSREGWSGSDTDDS